MKYVDPCLHGAHAALSPVYACSHGARIAHSPVYTCLHGAHIDHSLVYACLHGARIVHSLHGADCPLPGCSIRIMYRPLFQCVFNYWFAYAEDPTEDAGCVKQCWPGRDNAAAHRTQAADGFVDHIRWHGELVGREGTCG
eukprot:scaffold24530_cov22-Tisochrysis_lutea.AAC.2